MLEEAVDANELNELDKTIVPDKADEANKVDKVNEVDDAKETNEIVVSKANEADGDHEIDKANVADEDHKANEVNNAVGTVNNAIMPDDATKAREAIIIGNILISLTKFSTIFTEAKEYVWFKNNNQLFGYDTQIDQCARTIAPVSISTINLDFVRMDAGASQCAPSETGIIL